MRPTQQTIVRVKKRRTRFLMIDKTFLSDARIGLEGIGLLAWLLGKPDDWSIFQSVIASSTGTSQYKVRLAMEKLDAAGYVRRSPVRDLRSGRITRWDITVFETPELASDEDPQQPSLFEKREPRRMQKPQKPRFSRNTPDVEKPPPGLPADGNPGGGPPADGNLLLRSIDTEERSELSNDDERRASFSGGTAVPASTAVGDDVVVVLTQEADFDPTDARRLVERHGAAQVQQALRCLRQAPRPPGNPRGYVVQAVVNRWKPRTAVPGVSAAEATARAALELVRKRRAERTVPVAGS